MDGFETFMIFRKYDIAAKISIEDDIIYAELDSSIISDEDKEKLVELGWRKELFWNIKRFYRYV